PSRCRRSTCCATWPGAWWSAGSRPRPRSRRPTRGSRRSTRSEAARRNRAAGRSVATTRADLRGKSAVFERERPRGPDGLRRWLGPDYRLGFLFVLPIVALVLTLVAYPFFYAVYLSMTRKYVGVPPVFVGLENYWKLSHDGFFQRAVVNSAVFTFGSVGIK